MTSCAHWTHLKLPLQFILHNFIHILLLPHPHPIAIFQQEQQYNSTRTETNSKSATGTICDALKKTYFSKLFFFLSLSLLLALMFNQFLFQLLLWAHLYTQHAQMENHGERQKKKKKDWLKRKKFKFPFTVISSALHKHYVHILIHTHNIQKKRILQKKLMSSFKILIRISQ